METLLLLGNAKIGIAQVLYKSRTGTTQIAHLGSTLKIIRPQEITLALIFKLTMGKLGQMSNDFGLENCFSLDLVQFLYLPCHIMVKQPLNENDLKE